MNNVEDKLVELLGEYYHYKYMTTPWWKPTPKLNLEDFWRWLKSRQK